jgi:hypothetical protein
LWTVYDNTGVGAGNDLGADFILQMRSGDGGGFDFPQLPHAAMLIPANLPQDVVIFDVVAKNPYDVAPNGRLTPNVYDSITEVRNSANALLCEARHRMIWYLSKLLTIPANGAANVTDDINITVGINENDWIVVVMQESTGRDWYGIRINRVTGGIHSYPSIPWDASLGPALIQAIRDDSLEYIYVNQGDGISNTTDSAGDETMPQEFEGCVITSLGFFSTYGNGPTNPPTATELQFYVHARVRTGAPACAKTSFTVYFDGDGYIDWVAGGVTRDDIYPLGV